MNFKKGDRVCWSWEAIRARIPAGLGKTGPKPKGGMADAVGTVVHNKHRHGEVVGVRWDGLKYTVYYRVSFISKLYTK